jgi:hypothetical protein
LVLFAVAAVVSFAFPFFKEGIYKQLTWRPDIAIRIGCCVDVGHGGRRLEFRKGPDPNRTG